MRLQPVTVEIPGVEEDYRTADRFDRWRVGSLAFYMPGGFNTTAYLPLDAITSAYPHDFRVKGGCSCAGTIVTGGVVVRYGDNEVIRIIPGSEKHAPRLLAALKERLPDLDTEVPETYRNCTRKLV